MVQVMDMVQVTDLATIAVMDQDQGITIPAQVLIMAADRITPPLVTLVQAVAMAAAAVDVPRIARYLSPRAIC